jgi:hypothetical protein
MAISEKDFINAGYKKFTPHGIESDWAIVAYQKTVTDKNGIRYFISGYIADNSKMNLQKDAYELNKTTIKVQFNKGGYVLNVEYFLILDSLQDIESEIFWLWNNIGSPYYEKY